MLVTVVVVAAVLAVVLTRGGGKANPFAHDPQPPLFAAAAVAPLQTELAAVERRADAVAARWLDTHPGASAADFSRFALTAMGPPPGPAVQQRELVYLHVLTRRRSAAGDRAARWLELHGKKDIWKLYLKQDAATLAKPERRRAKALFKAAYKLAKTLAGSAKNRFARRSPYKVDPSLGALNQKRFANKARYSYPSKHAVIAAAEARMLARLDPPRRAEFERMAAEVDYSRLYGGGHYPSDIVRGALLGRLIADYELRVQGSGR